ncbi:hypothetical protein L1987_28433 [Smallanthus sonchifolius]|uniref:Uncharacterized protein n=1 Tax=Smallanthus sonchifolius TaxID=185202 RepID=A0ACB9HYD5_9ASTR|nr:hypothetical protein L1987_28433 [Smallanthus sonchifolius]
MKRVTFFQDNIMAGGGIPTALGGDKACPGNLTLYVTFTCVVATMGSLIFGYDIRILGGVTPMDPFLKKFFPSVHRRYLIYWF